jgi:uncharacterized protein YoxC
LNDESGSVEGVEEKDSAGEVFTEEQVRERVYEAIRGVDRQHDHLEREQNAEIERLVEQIAELKTKGRDLTNEEEKTLAELKKKNVALRKEISGTEAVKNILDTVKESLSQLSPLMATSLSATVVKNNKATAKAVVEGLEGVTAFFKEKFGV